MSDNLLKKIWWQTVDWVRYAFGRETRDQAWIDGSRDAEAGMQEALDDKDAYIEEQSEMILKLDDWLWEKGYGPELPVELEMWLRDHR